MQHFILPWSFAY
jgi:hypothetical protein